MSTQHRGILYIYPNRFYPVPMARTAAKRQISSAEVAAQQQRNKQEERARREAFRRERQIASYLAEDDNFPSFAKQLAKYGLQLRDIPGDGNCLFRALGDQLEGHGRSHFKHRLDVANFMYQHRKDFEPFVEDNISFDSYVGNLKKLGTYAGNDAIVAFARLNSVNIIIHQLSAPFLEIHGCPNPNVKQLHIAYHNGDHYSSVRRGNDGTESPANIRLMIDGKNDKPQQYNSGYHGYHNESVLYNTSSDGTARVIRGETDIEKQVMMATACKDIDTVRASLCDNEYDVETTITDVFQMMEITGKADTVSLTSQATTLDSGIWASNGSGSRVICPTTCSTHPISHSRDNSIASSGYGSLSSNHGGARPKNPATTNNQTSSTKQKRDKKVEKKKRSAERHKQQILGTTPKIDSESESDGPDLVTIAAQDAIVIRG